MRTRSSPELREVDDAAASRTRASTSGATAPTITAAAATRRAPRPAARSIRVAAPGTGPHRPPALHPAQAVGEQHGRAPRSGTARRRAAGCSSSRTVSAKRHERDGRQQARAAGCRRGTRARGREHRRPDRREPRPASAGRAAARAHLHPRLLAHERRRRARRAQRLESSAGRTRCVSGNTSSPTAIDESRTDARERGEHQVAPFEQRRRSTPRRRRRRAAAASAPLPSNTRPNAMAPAAATSTVATHGDQTLCASGRSRVCAIVPSTSSRG